MLPGVSQRHKANIERRKQPALPVEDHLLHTLPVPEEGGGVGRPLLLKKLSIAADVAGPMLRAWDFLHTTSQASSRHAGRRGVFALAPKGSVSARPCLAAFFPGDEP